jgi:hypothetical protein
MGKRLKGVVGTPLSGATKTEYYLSELRQWVRFAWIGEHGGALRVNATGKECNGLSVEEVNAACNVTIILSRMVRQGRNEWVRRLWNNRP